MKFKILGKPWKVRVLTKKAYKSKHGKDSVAITYLHKRRIDISPKGKDKETLVHELVHAYLAELCTHSADLDEQCSEEIFAELMAKFGFELLALADELYWKL